MSVTAVPLRPVRRSYLVWIWVAVAAALVLAALLARQGDPALLREARGSGIVTTASGLQYKVIEPGQGGPHPTATDVALVNYTGRLIDGTVFDASKQPAPMPLSSVLPGFAEALKLMPKGAKYRSGCPPRSVMAIVRTARFRPIRRWCLMSSCSTSFPNRFCGRCRRSSR